MFKWIIIATAFIIAGCAGYFSIVGIHSLFVGAPYAAMIMAAGLELGKLVSVSFVYRYWEKIHRALRVYFAVATITLMAITSIGVYGSLASAYAGAASGLSNTEQQIALIDTQTSSVDQRVLAITKRIESLEGLRTQQEARVDALTGKPGFNAAQKAIVQADVQINNLRTQMTTLTFSRDSLAKSSLEAKGKMTANSKIGTFYYIAKTFGASLDTVAKWFILAIVFAFDPLAISLLIAYNIVKDAENKSEITKSDIIVPDSTPTDDVIISRQELDTIMENDLNDETIQQSSIEVQEEMQDELKLSPQDKLLRETMRVPVPKE